MLADDLDHEIEAWERRTRGYQVWDYHVELEPPYSPLLGAARTQASTVIDDGRKPSFWDFLRGRVSQDAHALPREEPEVRPAAFRSAADLVELQLVLPEGFAVRPGFASEFLASLHNLSHPLSFELIGLPEGIVVQLCCAALDRSPVLEALRAYFPEIKVREHDGFLDGQWSADPRYGTLIDFGLSEYCFRLLRQGPHLDTDPLIPLVGALNDLADGELGLIQVLFHPAICPWGSDLLDLAPTIEDDKQLQSLFLAKFSEPILATLVRVAALSPDAEAAFSRARSIGNALISATRSDTNILLPLDDAGYPTTQQAEDILRRETHRSGMLLNLSELLTLVHLPSAEVRSSRMVRQSERTKQAPGMCLSRPLLLGINEHDGDAREVGLSTEQRLRHTYLIGASGTGKSTLMLSMIAQDLEQGNGLAVLDPHGDLVDDIIARIPDHRLSDVILFDPSDEQYPVGFNILSAHSELERTLLSSDLVGVFRRLSTSFGDQMVSVLGNAVLAFLESTQGGTLLDLRRFLVDASFRKRFLSTVTDPEVVYFWECEFTLLKGTPQAPLLTRLDTFLRPKTIRYMVAQKNDRLDFRAIMDKRKILLAKLSQGAIGEENSYLLGSLLVAKINQAAMMRQDEDKESRAPFYLYIDEFHNFVTPSIASILSGARKYGLGLTLAHQDMRQLRSRSEDALSAVLGNAYTRVVFRVGDSDARTLADGFSFFEAKDLQNLGIGEAIARVEQAAFDFNLKTIPLPEVDPDFRDARRNQVLEYSRHAYATPKSDIEVILNADHARPLATPEPKGQRKYSANDPGSESPEAQPQINPPKPERREALPAPESGRGGPQHKYLQSLIQRSAQDRGFRATLEKTVLGGHGHIDVAIERDGMVAACEISISTDVSHEIANLSKCLAAGFDYAILISSNKKTLRAAEDAMLAETSEDERDRLKFHTPETFIAFLDELDSKAQSNTKTIRGYKVNVKFGTQSEADLRERERLLSQVISKSLKRARMS